MKRLNKEQMNQWQGLKSEIEEHRDALELELGEFNSTMGAAWAQVEKVLIQLNEKVLEADQWRADLAAEMQDYYDERSERWQESDAGSAYQDWITEWEQDLNEVELECPEDVEMPEVQALDALEEMTEEPGG